MLCVEYYSEKGKGRIYPFWLIFCSGGENIFQKSGYIWSDVINNSIYGNMRRVEKAKSPVETGRFCRNGDIKK